MCRSATPRTRTERAMSPLPPASLTCLLQLTDSALPTGAFSHSFGLEAYLESGEVHDEATLLAWLDGFLGTQLTCTDAVAVRRAALTVQGPHLGDPGPHLGDDAGPGLRGLDAELTALLVPAQVRQASTRMGRRLLEIAAESFSSDAVASYAADVADGACAGHYPIAYALAGAGHGIDEETLVEAYIFSTL